MSVPSSFTFPEIEANTREYILGWGLSRFRSKSKSSTPYALLWGELFDVAVHKGGHVGDITLHARIQEAGGGGEEATPS